MLLGGAPAVHRLAGVVAHHVDQAGRREGLEVAIDGGQPDVLAALAQLVVELLGGAETVHALKQRDHRRPLPGGANTGADRTPRAAAVTAGTRGTVSGNGFH